MFTQFLFVLVALLGGLALSTAALADRQESLSGAQPVRLGNAQVDSHRPVVLLLNKEALADLDSVLDRLLTPPMDAYARPKSAMPRATLVWSQPDGVVRLLPVKGAAVPLPIVPHASGVYRYYLEWRDPAGRWALRLPPSSGTFKLEVDGARGPAVVDGPHDSEVPQGESIPIAIQISSPASVKSVVLHHWTIGATMVTSSAMELDDPKARTGTWRFSIPPPSYGVTGVEYFITLIDHTNATVRYGTSGSPFRVRIVPGLILPRERSR